MYANEVMKNSYTFKFHSFAILRYKLGAIKSV